MTHCMGDDQTDTYEHLNVVILEQLCPDSKDNRIVAYEKLLQRWIQESEGVDEVVCHTEKLLDQAFLLKLEILNFDFIL